MAGLLERNRIPLWIIPEKFVAEAAHRRGVTPDELEAERDGLPGVRLRPGIGRQVLDDAAALMVADRSAHHVIPFDLKDQCRELWCYAAVAVGLAGYYATGGASKKQCRVVGEVLGAFGCCSDGDKPECTKVATLEAALDNVGVPHGAGPVPADLDDVEPQITALRLLGLRVEWTSNHMGHFAVISGWQDDPEPSVWIDDPAGYHHFVELAELRAGSFKNTPCTWTDTYLTWGPPRSIRVPDGVWARVRAEAGGGAR